jgi:hypothetical protein
MMPMGMSDQDMANLAQHVVAWLPAYVMLGLAVLASLIAVAWTAIAALMRRLRNVWTG